MLSMTLKQEKPFPNCEINLRSLYCTDNIMGDILLLNYNFGAKVKVQNCYGNVSRYNKEIKKVSLIFDPSN